MLSSTSIIVSLWEIASVSISLCWTLFALCLIMIIKKNLDVKGSSSLRCPCVYTPTLCENLIYNMLNVNMTTGIMKHFFYSRWPRTSTHMQHLSFLFRCRNMRLALTKVGRRRPLKSFSKPPSPPSWTTQSRRPLRRCPLVLDIVSDLLRAIPCVTTCPLQCVTLTKGPPPRMHSLLQGVPVTLAVTHHVCLYLPFVLQFHFSFLFSVHFHSM